MANWSSAKTSQSRGPGTGVQPKANANGFSGARAFKRKSNYSDWTENAFVAHFINAALDARNDTVKQAVQFRPSSFPHCALLHSLAAYDDLTNSAYMELHKEATYGFEFYVDIGTAVHGVIQKYAAELSAAGSCVLAMWVCDNGACRHEVSWALRPKSLTCPACKTGLLKYEELSLKGRKLKGHVDMVLCQRVKTRRVSKKTGKFLIKKLYHLLEFKTTSEATLRSLDGVPNPLGYLPQDKHTIQVGLYAALLRRLGIVVSTVSLIYISRDKAAVAVKSPPLILTKKVDDTYIDFFDGKLTDAETSFEVMQEHAVPKRFEPEAFVGALWAARPCKSQADYAAYMAKGFFNADCPFALRGACWKKGAGVTPGRLLLQAATAQGQKPLADAVALAVTFDADKDLD